MSSKQVKSYHQLSYLKDLIEKQIKDDIQEALEGDDLAKKLKVHEALLNYISTSSVGTQQILLQNGKESSKVKHNTPKESSTKESKKHEPSKKDKTSKGHNLSNNGYSSGSSYYSSDDSEESYYSSDTSYYSNTDTSSSDKESETVILNTRQSCDMHYQGKKKCDTNKCYGNRDNRCKKHRKADKYCGKNCSKNKLVIRIRKE
jgi:hypothetical protein